MEHHDKKDGVLESREVSPSHERPGEQSQGHQRSGRAIMEGSDPSQENFRAWAREKERVVPGQDGTMTVGAGQVFSGFGGMGWPHLGETKPPPDTAGYHADSEGNQNHRGDHTALSMLAVGSEDKGKHDEGKHHGVFSKFHMGHREKKEGSKGEDVDLYQRPFFARIANLIYGILKAAHGGLIASVFQSTISTHFATTLRTYNQHDTITLHLEYIRPVSAGNAVLEIKDIRLGTATSTLHIVLTQSGRDRVAAYATNTNWNSAKGVTYPTDFSLLPAPTPAVDMSKLTAGTDPAWITFQTPDHPKSMVKVQSRLNFILPVAGQPHASILDEWITPPDPEERFTNESLGYVADSWPQICENYRPESPHSSAGAVKRAVAALRGESVVKGGWMFPFWYLTLLMDLDIKKALPAEGVRWLFVRARAKQIQDGRMDAEVCIMNERMELVALSNHVCSIVDAVEMKPGERKAREKKAENEAGSKL